VPIEPDTQSSLLETCKSVNGVLIAGVPGAGGYDAIFSVISDDGDDERSTFGKLLAAWEGRQVSVCPLLAREENSGILLGNAEALLR
jgi:phosphomevalonate kinase